ncbi:glutamate 5-kinase [Terrihalobacillus insolitus]|uniref:glutamate 5-kinase n=1 Tax=Terrihalobacillus insolitus TaxID=2950438 RepID=UPI00233F9AD3|nr:glutamate 5-kinase [Terrihalobacillus insolitus]MDC3414210.1 glutamate 5-kinase [Terrihalobacillus insolitus]
MAKQRIVVKIGSSSLTNSDGSLCTEKITEHVTAISKLTKQGDEVILISSGAVAAGFPVLGYRTRPVTLAGKQAAAAVGQGLLMQKYYEYFQLEGIVTAQLLLTRQNFSQQDQYNNAYSTLTELLKRGVLPIINENDSIAVDELTFGDNDMLSALVSGLTHADFLIILTDINGLYDGIPHKHSQAKKYTFLPEITDDLLAIAGKAGSKVGTGGMRSKLEAVKTALSIGVQAFIGKGEGTNKLLDIASGKGDGTYIGYSINASVKNKKQWIGIHSNVAGRIVIDAGAECAVLINGKSLLPSGVKALSGTFESGDVVEVWSEKGDLIGKGQINFTAEELALIKGYSNQEAKVKTKRDRAEVIHRNNWVTLTKERMLK